MKRMSYCRKVYGKDIIAANNLQNNYGNLYVVPLKSQVEKKNTWSYKSQNLIVYQILIAIPIYMPSNAANAAL